jgi:hypothetical protein
MRLVWRRLPPGGSDHELLWLVVSMTGAVARGLWLGFGLPWPHCPFLAMTGFPCLTCGATRCALNLFHGSFLQAFWWNPLAFAALCGAALFDLYSALVLLARLPRLRLVDWTRPEKHAVRIGVLALIAANWIYLLTHRARF